MEIRNDCLKRKCPLPLARLQRYSSLLIRRVKRASIVIILFISLGLTGCSGVIMNKQYSHWLDRQAALSAEIARRAREGKLTNQQMANALQAQADAWRLLQNARDGIAPQQFRKVGEK